MSTHDGEGWAEDTETAFSLQFLRWVEVKAHRFDCVRYKVMKFHINVQYNGGAQVITTGR